MQYLNVIFGGSNILVRLRCSCSSGSSDNGAPLAELTGSSDSDAPLAQLTGSSDSNAPLAQLLPQLGEELSLLPPVGAQSGLGFLNFDIDTGMWTQYSEMVKIK